MTHRDITESESERENESEGESESSRFDLIKEVTVQKSGPGDYRIPIPQEVKKKVEADGDGSSYVHFNWYLKHDVPVISSDSLREDGYSSAVTVKVTTDESSTDKIRPPCTDDETDYISYAGNNDSLYWLATEDMPSDDGASSAYLVSCKKLLMMIDESNSSISNEFAKSPNYTITNTRQQSVSNPQIPIFNIFTDIFGT